MYNHEKSKHAVKSSSTKTHSSILRLSLRQYIEQQTDITLHLFQSVSLNLSLCTSATQLMYEPCNVLQSGPCFDFIQPVVTYLWNLCSASAIQLLNLGNSFAIQFILICCMSKLSQHNTSLWFHAFRFRLAQPVICSKILKSISLMAMTIRANFPNDFVRHSQVQFKLQISNPRFPLLLFTLSHTPTQNYTTVLLLSQDTLQSLVVQDVQPTRPKVRKGNPPGSTTPNPSCSQTPSLPKKVPRPT